MNDLSPPYRPRAVRLVGVASGSGAPDPRCAAAPDSLDAAALIARLGSSLAPAQWTSVIRPPAAGDAGPLATTRDICARLAQRVESIVANGDLPAVIGGDHSCAIGTWKGAIRARAAHGAIGLLWIDAHMDAHTPQTTETGMLNGMPLACLLGYGDPDLTGIAGGAVLDPRWLCLFGVRSYEKGEAALLERLGVRVISMTEIAAQGLDSTLRKAFTLVSGAPGGFGISVDLDAIDPRDAPAVGTPVPGGLHAGQLVRTLRDYGRSSRLVAVEIAEYNPSLDREAITRDLMGNLLDAMVTGPNNVRDAPAPIALEKRYGAHCYDPLPVVLVRGQGVNLWDDRGRRYVDMMSAYSAVSHGHAHPRILAALQAQASRLAVTSRAYYNDRLPALLQRLCEITGQDLALRANTGLETVEVALRTARKWGNKVKHIPSERVEIIACHGNFHGRSIAILGLSTDAQYRDCSGPFPPGLKTIRYGDAEAPEHAITANTTAFLVEPIQAEAGDPMGSSSAKRSAAAFCRYRPPWAVAACWRSSSRAITAAPSPGIPSPQRSRSKPSPCSSRVVRIARPLIMTRDELDAALAEIRDVLHEVAAQLVHSKKRP